MRTLIILAAALLAIAPTAAADPDPPQPIDPEPLLGCAPATPGSIQELGGFIDDVRQSVKCTIGIIA